MFLKRAVRVARGESLGVGWDPFVHIQAQHKFMGHQNGDYREVSAWVGPVAGLQE